MDGKINRIKVMLVDKGKTNRWLAKLLNVDMNDHVRIEALSKIPSPEKTEKEIYCKTKNQ